MANALLGRSKYFNPCRPVHSADLLSLPYFPVGAKSRPFPVIILCRDEEEFSEMLPIAPYIYRLACRNLLDRYDISKALTLLRDRECLVDILTSSGLYFPVFEGNDNREMITLCWYVSVRSANAQVNS